MTDPRTIADYLQVATPVEDEIVVVDRGGYVSRFGTAQAYETFLAGISAVRQSLYDETTGRWMVGTLDQLIDDSPGAGWPERLRAVRKMRGMTLAQMATALGYGHGTYVANLESGRATITPMLERLIAAYEARGPISEAEHAEMAHPVR